MATKAPLHWKQMNDNRFQCISTAGHLETARLLIEKYGADKKAKNDHGQVALELVYELTPEWSKMFAEV